MPKLVFRTVPQPLLVKGPAGPQAPRGDCWASMNPCTDGVTEGVQLQPGLVTTKDGSDFLPSSHVEPGGNTSSMLVCPRPQVRGLNCGCSSPRETASPGGVRAWPSGRRKALQAILMPPEVRTRCGVSSPAELRDPRCQLARAGRPESELTHLQLQPIFAGRREVEGSFLNDGEQGNNSNNVLEERLDSLLPLSVGDISKC